MHAAKQLNESMASFLPRLAALPSLAENPKAFARLRREILEAYFASLSAERRANMQIFQENIDDFRALAGTPRRALSEMLNMLDDSTDMLQRLVDAQQQGGS